MDPSVSTGKSWTLVRRVSAAAFDRDHAGTRWPRRSSWAPRAWVVIALASLQLTSAGDAQAVRLGRGILRLNAAAEKLSRVVKLQAHDPRRLQLLTGRAEGALAKADIAEKGLSACRKKAPADSQLRQRAYSLWFAANVAQDALANVYGMLSSSLAQADSAGKAKTGHAASASQTERKPVERPKPETGLYVMTPHESALGHNAKTLEHAWHALEYAEYFEVSHGVLDSVEADRVDQSVAGHVKEVVRMHLLTHQKVLLEGLATRIHIASEAYRAPQVAFDKLGIPTSETAGIAEIRSKASASLEGIFPRSGAQTELVSLERACQVMQQVGIVLPPTAVEDVASAQRTHVKLFDGRIGVD